MMDYEYYDDYDIMEQNEHDDGAVYEEEYYNDQASGHIDIKSHSERLTEAFDVCIVPSVVQIVGYMITLMLCCIVYRVVCWLLRKRHFNEYRSPMHLVSIACGLCALYLTLGRITLIVLVISTVTYLLVQLFQYSHVRGIGFIIAVVTIISQFIYEFSWPQPEAWHRVRGVQMVANMKIISLVFDIEEQSKATEKQVKLPTFLSYLGYIFCPATCALGPWISFQSYMHSLSASSTSSSGNRIWLWLPQTLLNMLISVVFLCVSNCIAPLVGIGNAPTEHSIWFDNYIDALGVRASHYFVSFLAQAGLSAAGVSLIANAKPNKALGQLVTKPWHIEFPRSLSSLVRIWNIPMHNWLKKYIYRLALQHFNNSYLSALMCTYVVSSMLHGVHLRIYFVLISLAAFSYVELKLRAHLADLFDLCIGANVCNKDCTRSTCPLRNGMMCKRSWLTWLINLFFTAVAILNLAYLGIMLVDNETDLRASVSMLWKWEQVDYLNHYVAFGAFILYLFIS